MGRITRLVGLTALAGLVIPPIAAAITKQRLISQGQSGSWVHGRVPARVVLGVRS
jgi:hypothetical protein